MTEEARVERFGVGGIVVTTEAELTTTQEQQRERFFDYITEQVEAPRTGVLSASVTDGYVRVGYHDGVGPRGKPKVRYQWFQFNGRGAV